MLKFLLHTCCAPCGIAVIDELKSQYDLTVFFYNPNIYPEEEYLKRKKYVIQICQEWRIPMIDMDYEVDKWNEVVRGLENEPEGGARCLKCFGLRLERTARYAKENNFDIFCTTLTSGRNKKAEVINPIGLELGVKYGVKFFATDWKKAGRQQKARKMVEERGIYRQNYCGCKFSFATSVETPSSPPPTRGRDLKNN
ncbi:MAG: epoxyqueuosine reductase QueH [Candidatus Magasanikbacteria bacterium]|nr:epoxyqueuosine reductase QueH [Candidatus Magasanikbacteria bacterium]